MIISVSNSYTHKVPCEKTVRNEKELEQKVMNSLQTLGLSSEDVSKDMNGNLVLPPNANSLKLHTLMLQMEKLGLELKLTKKTFIEIC